MKGKKIVILAGKGVSSNIVYHYLKQFYNIEAIIFENPPSRKKLIKRRIRKVGFFKVIGQLVFMVLVVRWLHLVSKSRKKEIIEQFHLNDSLPPLDKSMFVNSINDKIVTDKLNELQPDLIIVNGTRIISKKILDSQKVRFINTHAGITPKYRNVHGAYWALVNNDKEHCGVTIHLVDQGIDTGSVIYQRLIHPTKKDNFVTYPLLQVAEGAPYLKKAVDDVFADNLNLVKGPKESALWYHPTIWQYLYNRMKYGVK